MHKIDYEITINEENRPIVKMADDYKDMPEDKFFVIEMTRYFLQKILTSDKIKKYDQNSIDMMDITVRLLGQTGDEMANMIWDMMSSMGSTDIIFNTNKHHVELETEEELENYGEVQFFNEKVFYKQDGLKVLIKETQNMYEYDNEEFKKITNE